MGIRIDIREYPAIVAAKGKRSASELGWNYGVTASCIKGIWKREREGKIATQTLNRRKQRIWRDQALITDVNVPFLAPNMPPIVAAALDEPVIETGPTFMQLEADDCRWRTGKDAEGDFRFCGCKCIGGKGIKAMYCPEHAGRVAADPANVESGHRLGTMYGKKNGQFAVARKLSGIERTITVEDETSDADEYLMDVAA